MVEVILQNKKNVVCLQKNAEDMTHAELKERQGWSLEKKIDHSLGAIEQFYETLDGKVYVGFSGGKDSTVLLWLARKLYPDIKAVFVNTGNEYPDIVRFVRKKKEEGANIDIIYPKLKPREVMSKYGFPLVSKETSQRVRSVRYNPNSVKSMLALGTLPPELRAKYTMDRKLAERWKWLIDEQFNTSDMCCDKLKKEPAHYYQKETGRAPILGIMADESRSRKLAYLSRGGCNIFSDKGLNSSHPLSIWTEQDIWDCIEKYDIEIADIYRKGADRTGCMFCGYGCQFADDNRLKLVYDLYPKAYEMFMNYENNGVKYRDALRKVLNVNKLKLPDE